MKRLRWPGRAMRSIVRTVSSGRMTLMRFVMDLKLNYLNHIIYTLSVYVKSHQSLTGRQDFPRGTVIGATRKGGGRVHRVLGQAAQPQEEAPHERRGPRADRGGDAEALGSFPGGTGEVKATVYIIPV